MTRFTKAQLTEAKRYIRQSDLVGVLLEEGQGYTVEEVDVLIKEFMERKVN